MRGRGVICRNEDAAGRLVDSSPYQRLRPVRFLFVALIAIGIVLLTDGFLSDGEAFIAFGIMFLLIWFIWRNLIKRRELEESAPVGRRGRGKTRPSQLGCDL